MSKYNISRGHSDKCIGADDILSEIKEAEKVLNATSSAFKCTLISKSAGLALCQFTILVRF